MVRRCGPRLTAAQKAELWRRWRQGESLNAIGRALGRIPKMVHYIVAGAGGIPPVPRRRARQALTPDRAGGHLSRHGLWFVPSADQPGPGARPVDGESGSAAPRWPPSVSGRTRRPAGMGARPAPEALSLGDAPGAA